jgi:hypothetical protein
MTTWQIIAVIVAAFVGLVNLTVVAACLVAAREEEE